jgi:hypothetical protein
MILVVVGVVVGLDRFRIFRRPVGAASFVAGAGFGRRPNDRSRLSGGVFLQYCPSHRCRASLLIAPAGTKMGRMPHRSPNRRDRRGLRARKEYETNPRAARSVYGISETGLAWGAGLPCSLAPGRRGSRKIARMPAEEIAEKTALVADEPRMAFRPCREVKNAPLPCRSSVLAVLVDRKSSGRRRRH